MLTDSAEDNRYTHTGREWDEGLGLYHFRAIMYDAGSGRFCGRDEIGFQGGINFYAATAIANGLLDPLGNEFSVTQLYKTVAEIRAEGGPRYLAFTKKLTEDCFPGSILILGSMACDCYCTWVDGSSTIKAELEIETWLPWPIPLDSTTSDYFTDRGWREMVEHEESKISVGENGYNAFLKPAGDSILNASVCRRNPTAADDALNEFIRMQKLLATTQFDSYYRIQNVGRDGNDGINMENQRMHQR